MTNLKPGNWNDFNCFLPGPALDGKDATHFLWQYGNNANGLLDEANDKAIRARLAQFDEDDVSFDEIPSGLRGVHIYSALVRVVNENGKPTAAAEAVEKIIKELSDYPVLDDELYSGMQYEAWCESVHDELRYMGFDPDEVADEVIAMLNEMEVEDREYVDTDDLRLAIEKLGLPDPELREEVRVVLGQMGLKNVEDVVVDALSQRKEVVYPIDFGLVRQVLEERGVTAS